jgi:lipopolysaccharide export system permease protein
MDTLDRYLVKEFVLYFLFLLLLLGTLFVGIDFLSKFWGWSMPTGRLIALFLCKIPNALQQFVPVAALMATLLVLSTMSRQNEILALYSNGVGTMRLLSTLIAAVATIATISFLLFDSLVPIFNKKQILLEKGMDTSQEYVVSEDRSGFWYRSNNLLYNVGRFNASDSSLENIRVYTIDSNFNLLETTRARRAHFVDDHWQLEDGVDIIYSAESKFPVSKQFDTKVGAIPEKPSDFKTLIVQEDIMRLRELRAYIKRNSSYGLDTTVQRVLYHERLAYVFTPLIFVLLAIPFSIRPLKTQSTAKSIAMCFLIVFIYLVITRFSLSIGKGGHIPAIVAGWLPNMLFALFAAFVIFRRDHAT